MDQYRECMCRRGRRREEGGGGGGRRRREEEEEGEREVSNIESVLVGEGGGRKRSV